MRQAARANAAVLHTAFAIFSGFNYVAKVFVGTVFMRHQDHGRSANQHDGRQVFDRIKRHIWD